MFINVVSGKLRFTYDTKNLYNSHTVINVVKNSDLKIAKHVSALKAIRQFGLELSEKYNWNALEDKNDKEAYNIFYSTIYNDLLKVLPTQEQPDQNAPDGLPPIDRSIDSCS